MKANADTIFMNPPSPFPVLVRALRAESSAGTFRRGVDGGGFRRNSDRLTRSPTHLVKVAPASLTRDLDQDDDDARADKSNAARR